MKRSSGTQGDAREMPAADAKPVPAPVLDYQPKSPRKFRPRIGLIGCGGISATHLKAYRLMGYDVVAICSRREESARERQQAFYPGAEIHTDHRSLLERKDIDVVDIATPPSVRAAQIADALTAGKHVLSQKPFTLDLREAERLVAMAKRRNLRLAVNQNGRWAPYFAYLRELVRTGHLGAINSVSMSLAWDHTWIKGTAFESLHHVLFYDFAIHWLDMICCLFDRRRASGVHAALGQGVRPSLAPPLNGHALITFPQGQATLSLCARTPHGNVEHILVSGTRGLYQATGPICAAHDIRVTTAAGESRPSLMGHWFPDGFAGAMGELLCAIEENREPENAAANNLHSLALCFAVLESTRTGRTELPGRILQAGKGCLPQTSGDADLTPPPAGNEPTDPRPASR